MGLPLSDCSPVGVGRMLGVVVVRVVRVVLGCGIHGPDVGEAVVFLVLDAVVPPPGSVETGFGANADRTVSGEAMATPITPSATTRTRAVTALATRGRRLTCGCGWCAGGYGCICGRGTGGWDCHPACAGGTGRTG